MYIFELSPRLTRDSVAFFSMYFLCRLLSHREDNLLPSYWIAGYDAYMSLNRVLSLWSKGNLRVCQDYFNYWHSSARIHIDQAFEILIGRWRIFWRPMRVFIDKAVAFVLSCVMLHIFIIDDSQEGAVVYSPSEIDFSGHKTDADMCVHLQDQCDIDVAAQHRRRNLDVLELQRDLTDLLEMLRITRLSETLYI